MVKKKYRNIQLVVSSKTNYDNLKTNEIQKKNYARIENKNINSFQEKNDKKRCCYCIFYF